MHKAEPYATKIDVGRAILPADALSSASRRRLKAGGSQDLGTCNITQFAQNPLAGISAVAAFSCTCILSETANQPKLDISGQNGYFCKFLGSACPTNGTNWPGSRVVFRLCWNGPSAREIP